MAKARGKVLLVEYQKFKNQIFQFLNFQIFESQFFQFLNF